MTKPEHITWSKLLCRGTYAVDCICSVLFVDAHHGTRCVSALWSCPHPAWWEEVVRRSFGKGRPQSRSLTTTLISPTWSLPKSEKLTGKIMSGSSSKAWWIVWQAVSSLRDLELLIGKVCYKGVHEYLVLYWV